MADQELPKSFGKMTEPDAPFSLQLSALCSRELVLANKNTERIGVMIERLTNALAFTIAIAAQGNPKAMDTLLGGAEHYMYELAAEHVKLGRLIGNIK